MNRLKRKRFTFSKRPAMKGQARLIGLWICLRFNMQQMRKKKKMKMQRRSVLERMKKTSKTITVVKMTLKTTKLSIFKASTK